MKQEEYSKIRRVKEDIINRNEEIFGETICITYLIEELSELIKEMTKQVRNKGSRDRIVEEIGDVYYTLSMVIKKFSITDEEINASINYKIAMAEYALNELTTSSYE